MYDLYYVINLLGKIKRIKLNKFVSGYIKNLLNLNFIFLFNKLVIPDFLDNMNI